MSYTFFYVCRTTNYMICMSYFVRGWDECVHRVSIFLMEFSELCTPIYLCQ